MMGAYRLMEQARHERGVRSGDRAQALRALVPIAVGHAASIASVAGAVLLGGDSAARPIAAASPLTLALAAIGVHTAAMLAVTAAIAAGACRGFAAGQRWRLIRASNGSVHTSRP